MSQRALWVVAAIAVLSLAIVFLAGPGSDTAGPARQPFWPELEAALSDIDRMEIAVGGSETVATLVRDAQSWSVIEKDGYPANLATLRTALNDLAQATAIEAKTANPEFYDRLGVEDVALESASGVALTASTAGSMLPTVILGDTVGTSYRYARRGDQAQSYLIDRDPEVPRDIAQWLVTDIMDVRGTRVQQVTISHADGERVSIAKTDPAQSDFTVADVPEGRELLYPGVANVVGNALRELKLEDVARQAEASEPTATIEFKTFDGLVIVARAYTVEDAGWLTFAASFDAAQAVEFATEAVETPLAETDAAPDPRAEAERIERRVAGWRYRIPSYQYDQITRRMADLLKARS